MEAGARIHGNASRDPESTPKKSFRIVFKEIYGDGELNYPLWDDYEVDHFDTLLLRAGYNLTWTHWDPTQRARSLYVRDAFAVDFYLANDDWPENNWYAARMRPDGMWRFFSWDAEHIFEELSTDMTGTGAANSPAQLWLALISDLTFKEAVQARAAELLAEDGALGVTASTARFDARIAEIEGAVLAESARWGDYRSEVFCYSSPPCPTYTVDEYWAVELARIEDEYLPLRMDVFAAQLAARGF